MRMSKIVLMALAVIALQLSGCGGGAEDSEELVIRMGFAPSEDSQLIQDEAKRMAEIIEEKTGLKVKVNVLPSYSTMVAALQSDNLDFAWLPPLTYVQARNAGVARVLLKVVRNNNPWYYGAIVVHKDSEYQTIEDLEGKVIGWGDTTSFSGHIFPKYSLMKMGIDPDEFFAAQRYLGSHTAVVTNVLNKNIDAGGCYSNNLEGDDGAWTQRLQDPEDQKQFRVLLYTDPIPGDTFSVRKAFAEENPGIVKQMVELMKSLPTDPDGMEVMDKLYHVQELIEAEDSDYDVVRDATKEVIRD